MMKLIVAGSRTINDYSIIKWYLDIITKNKDVTIISGGAKGADKLGEIYSREVLKKEPEIYKPDYEKYDGKKAPLFRNEEMAKNATHCIIFWDGVSTGSMHMKMMCQMYGVKCKIIKM